MSEQLISRNVDNILGDDPEPEPTPAAREPDVNVSHEYRQLQQPAYQPTGFYGPDGSRYSTEQEFMDLDPIGHSQAWLAQQQVRINAAEAREAQREMLGHTAQQVAAYKEDQPAYIEAFNHLFSTRERELQNLGYSKPEVQQVIHAEAAALASRAAATGRNAGQMIWDLANARGFDAGAALERMSDREFEKYWDAVENQAKKGGYVKGVRSTR